MGRPTCMHGEKNGELFGFLDALGYELNNWVWTLNGLNKNMNINKKTKNKK